jgi:hypothetical protein
MGFAKTLSAITPVAEGQAEWVADLIEGRTRLPEPARMQAEIASDERKIRRRYSATPKLTVELDVYRYLAQLEKDRKRGLYVGEPARGRIPAQAAAPATVGATAGAEAQARASTGKH